MATRTRLSEWFGRNNMVSSRHSRQARARRARRMLRVPVRLEALEDRALLANTIVVIDVSSTIPAQWTIAGDNDGNNQALFGAPFTAQSVAPVPGQTQTVAQLAFAGNVSIPANTTIQGKGGEPISLLFGSDLNVGANVSFDVSAAGATPGPGGGARRRSSARRSGHGSNPAGGRRSRRG